MLNDYINNAKNKDVLTKFLSPEEQRLLTHNKVKFSDLGYERKRAWIFCEEEKAEVDFQLTALEVIYNQKFALLTHSQVLGALMGLGIVRECIGDIYVDDKIYILVISEMAPFIITNLTQIGKTKVKVQSVDLDVIRNLPINIYEETTIVVASLRLDAIVSNITTLSREKAKTYIELKNVKVNGNIVTSSDHILKMKDLISIHRYGRTIIKDVLRKTKKDKLVLLVDRTK